jgi:hypothetical protein
VWKEGRGKDGERRDPCGCGGRPARQRGEEERKGGEGETDGWGPGVSESRGKKKKREREAGRRGVRDDGLLGHLGRKVRRVRFSVFFFFFFFKLLLKPLFFSNSNQNSFKLFLKNL